MLTEVEKKKERIYWNCKFLSQNLRIVPNFSKIRYAQISKSMPMFQENQNVSNSLRINYVQLFNLISCDEIGERDFRSRDF